MDLHWQPGDECVVHLQNPSCHPFLLQSVLEPMDLCWVLQGAVLSQSFMYKVFIRGALGLIALIEKGREYAEVERQVKLWCHQNCKKIWSYNDVLEPIDPKAGLLTSTSVSFGCGLLPWQQGTGFAMRSCNWSSLWRVGWLEALCYYTPKQGPQIFSFMGRAWATQPSIHHRKHMALTLPPPTHSLYRFPGLLLTCCLLPHWCCAILVSHILNPSITYFPWLLKGWKGQ